MLLSRIALAALALMAYATLAFVAYPAHAAETAKPKPASATDASAPVPQAKYDSAVTGYQPYREQKLAPWRELNDEVHRAGGHIGIVGGAAGKPAAHPPEHKK